MANFTGGANSAINRINNLLNDCGVLCSGEPVLGCTDATATNYDPAANIDDGSCKYCYDNMFTLEMFDSFGDGWNGNNFTITTFAGNLAGSATITTGSTGSAQFCVPDG